MNERKVLFRGKREDNGEWVFGFYLEARACDGKFHFIVDEDGEYYKINPKTRGEFTGLYDKNDKMIFEGDICEWGKGDICEWGKGFFVSIEYITEYTRFAGTNGNSICGLGTPLVEEEEKRNRVEVVGNIYDNPEFNLE